MGDAHGGVIGDSQDDIDNVEWGRLPSDVLLRVFNQLFAAMTPADWWFTPARRCSASWPLSLAVAQLRSLRLVCKHWGEVLNSSPPPLCLAIDVPVPVDLMRRWLPAQRVVALHVLDPARTSNASSANSEGAAEHPPDPSRRLMSRFDVIAGADGIGPQPFWSLSALPHLRSLSLCCPDTAQHGISFTADAIQALTGLHDLSLEGFRDYDLQALPPTARRLWLAYDHVPIVDSFAAPQISIVDLPSGCSVRLEELYVCKAGGVLGLQMAQLLERCDRQLTTVFEVPYRIGNYVPPHILADQEAVDASNGAAERAADHLLAALASSAVLRAMTFSSDSSIKLIPYRSGAAADSGDGSTSSSGGAGSSGEGACKQALSWIHGVTQQATFYLYGVDETELQDHLQYLQASGRLRGGHLLEIEQLVGASNYDPHSFKISVTPRGVGDEEVNGACGGGADGGGL